MYIYYGFNVFSVYLFIYLYESDQTGIFSAKKNSQFPCLLVLRFGFKGR